MPRRPRIDLAGYHHIINRGVNRSDIFVDDSDYKMIHKVEDIINRNEDLGAKLVTIEHS